MFNWIKKLFNRKSDSFQDLMHEETILQSKELDAKIAHYMPKMMEWIRALEPDIFYEQFTDNDIIIAYEEKRRYEDRNGVYDPVAYQNLYGKLWDKYK